MAVRGAVAPLARWYTDLRSATAKAVLTAESVALRTTAEILPRSLTGNPGHNTRAAKKQKGS